MNSSKPNSQKKNTRQLPTAPTVALQGTSQDPKPSANSSSKTVPLSATDPTRSDGPTSAASSFPGASNVKPGTTVGNKPKANGVMPVVKTAVRMPSHNSNSGNQERSTSSSTQQDPNPTLRMTPESPPPGPRKRKDTPTSPPVSPSKYAKPMSTQQKHQMNMQYVVMCLTEPLCFTRPESRSKGFCRVALVEILESDEKKVDILQLTAWANPNSTRGADILKKLETFTSYSVSGVQQLPAVNFSKSSVNFNSQTRVNVIHDKIWDSPSTQNAISSKATQIAGLQELENRRPVLINGRVLTVEKNIKHTTLKGKVTVYDASGCCVEVSIFMESADALNGIDVDDSVLLTAKTRIIPGQAGRMNLTLEQVAVNINQMSKQDIVPDIPLGNAEGSTNLSQNSDQIFQLLAIRPNNTAWFSAVEVTIKRVYGDYVSFFCPDCDSPLWLEEEEQVWKCTVHGPIMDKDIVFKCIPTLDLTLEDQEIKGVSVKYGQEHVLFGKTCQEIVDAGGIDSIQGAKFSCTLGIGLKKLIVLNLQKKRGALF
jgi:hypothetical protein